MRCLLAHGNGFTEIEHHGQRHAALFGEKPGFRTPQSRISPIGDFGYPLQAEYRQGDGTMIWRAPPKIAASTLTVIAKALFFTGGAMMISALLVEMIRMPGSVFPSGITAGLAAIGMVFITLATIVQAMLRPRKKRERMAADRQESETLF